MGDSHLRKPLDTETHKTRAGERKNRKMTEFGELNPKAAGQSTLDPL